MRRIHAPEWEDYRWFPQSWRNYSTDYLRFVAVRFNMYKAAEPIIIRGLDASGQARWVDCASGGGGGLIRLAQSLRQQFPALRITLTDFYPNIDAFNDTRRQMPEVFDFVSEPVDIMNMPEEWNGQFRTMFAAFHHFRPAHERQILQNAVDTGSPIAIFEPLNKNAVSVFSMFFVIINVLIFTLFIKPVRWKVLPFIYLLPLIPLYVLWDGIASILRIYSVKEMNEMIAELDDVDQFYWETGQTPGPMPLTYLLGYRKRQDE